jgi:hypothetical protein
MVPSVFLSCYQSVGLCDKLHRFSGSVNVGLQFRGLLFLSGYVNVRIALMIGKDLARPSKMQNIGSRVINIPGVIYVSGLNTVVFQELPDNLTVTANY